MNELAKEIRNAVAMLSALNVSGDAVDVMAAAKHKLRTVAAKLEEEKADGR